MLAATLIQAVAAGLVLIVAPLAVPRRGRRREAERRPGLAYVALYFLCLGLTFLAVETAFIQRFTPGLLHGHALPPGPRPHRPLRRILGPLAWAVNGCASVVRAVAATLGAVHFDFLVVALAADFHALAALAFRRV